MGGSREEGEVRREEGEIGGASRARQGGTGKGGQAESARGGREEGWARGRQMKGRAVERTGQEVGPRGRQGELRAWQDGE